MTPPSISIVLPTKNGAASLPALLDALARQRVDAPFEIVAVDSSSTDGTVELMRRRTDRLISIPADQFDHGLARNRGIQEATGELVVLLVQDAVPASDSWLSALITPLLADSRLAGTFARQQARPDAGALAHHYLAGWMAASDVPRTFSIDDVRAFEALDPRSRLDRCGFDNVCSCIRRTVWAAHPFRSTPIGEDLEWAREVLLSGYRLAYVPDAVVMHSHHRPATYELARTVLLHRRLYELFGLRTIPTLPRLARAIASSLRLHWRLERTARSLALAVAWPLGQYLGAVSAVRGWKPFRSRRV
ncbi:MAG TPA: glycosyltransferase [Vicinamibacterales bacterium]|nr:glycosyltransferase [Vicinamibacterales bacterium]